MSARATPAAERPAESFPYEQLLAFYRGRMEDPAEAAVVERRILDDARWRAHFESVEHLDLERASVLADARRLRTFLEGPVSELTAMIAKTDGEVLSDLFDDARPESIAGRARAEWLEYLAECPYGRRMRRRAYSARRRREANVPDGEKLLGDWLLDHYYADDLERITQTVALQASLADAEGPFDAPGEGARDMLGLDEGLIVNLQEALARPVEDRGEAVYETIYNDDPLYALAAGEDENVVWASPLWFTCLAESPDRISWDPGAQGGPWRLRLWNAAGKMLCEVVVDRPEFAVTESVREGLDAEEDVSWEVQPVGVSGRESLVRGVFRVLAPARREAVAERLTKIAACPAGINRELAAAKCHFAAGLFDAAAAHLRSLEARYVRGTASFLVHRALAAVFLAVSRELTGVRSLGNREGIWATNQASQSLAAAYAALRIRWEEG